MGTKYILYIFVPISIYDTGDNILNKQEVKQLRAFLGFLGKMQVKVIFTY